ncbi:MAG TPA: ABC transporter permease [Acidobacteriaceae bacterium]|jgi:putative ABC transport system permease protein|nr:ABC transporter permease [Acidobacteriaceae bacterium]
MERWSWLKSVWRNLFSRSKVERDLDDEVGSYVEMAVEEKIAAGVPPSEARRAILAEFGGTERLKGSVRDVRAGSSIESLLQDVLYGIRGLRKNPGFVAVVGFSLALGIGANSTIFSVLNTLLYRPLPYRHPDRLVAIWQTEMNHPDWRVPPPIAELNDWKQQNHVFEDIALTSQTQTSSISGLGAPEPIRLQYVTPTFFHVLQVKPILGRVFIQGDLHDKDQTIVLSYAYWKRRFHSDPDVLGRVFTIQGVTSTVVGVMPAGFAPFYGDRIDLWWPINPFGARYVHRIDHWLMPVARLKPGISIEQAQRQMDVIASRLANAYPETNKGVDDVVVPLQQQLFGRIGRTLYPLFGAVAFVLLIACVNVVNLLQSRTETRRKEFALRATLGAGRGRLVRQLLTESGLLALMGGALGVALTFGGIALFRALAGDFPNAANIRVDSRVLLFTLGVSVATAFLVGLAPAIYASRPDLNLALQEGDRRTATASRGYTRRLLAISEVALAMVLLVGAGLMINTVLHLQQVNPGFNARNVTTMEIQLPAGGKYLAPVPGQDMGGISPRVPAFYQQLLEKVSAFPGVQSVGIASALPTRAFQGYSFSIVGHAPPPAGQRPGAGSNVVSPGFFHVLQIPLLRGRYLDEHDTQNSPWSVVINQAFARRYFPNENPLGQQLLLRYGSFDIDEAHPRQIVGVVGNIKQNAPQDQAEPFVYVSYLQQAQILPGGWVESLLHQTLVLRTAPELARQQGDLAAEVKNAVAGLDADQPVTDVMSMQDVLGESISGSRFYMRLLAIFAAIAALLAAIGIYGVMSYFVSERTHEIGIRLAMGARRWDVLALVGKLGLQLTLIGVAIGAVLALGLAHLIAGMLFGVKPDDPITYVAVAAGLIAVALLACFVPARRASTVDPMVALRWE